MSEDLDASACEECDAKGWNWGWLQVDPAGNKQEFKIECEACQALGYVGPDAITLANRKEASA